MNQQQMTGTGGQTGMMQQPPAILTTKDHLYLEDMLSWNLNAVKKTNFFAGQVQDQEIKDAINQMCRMHQKHYQTLLNHMQQHMQTQNQGMAQSQGMTQGQSNQQPGGMQ